MNVGKIPRRTFSRQKGDILLKILDSVTQKVQVAMHAMICWLQLLSLLWIFKVPLHLITDNLC